MKKSLMPIVLMSFVAGAAAQESSSADVFSSIRAFLPDAKQAVALPTPPEPTPAQPEVKKHEYTPDAPVAADVSPEAHPEAYKSFVEKLNEQAQHNLYDFCPAMEVVLSATNDQFAALAWMEKAAKEDVVAAMQYVADLRMRRVPREKLQAPEMVEAYNMARKAADAGFDPAKVNVTMCLKNGIGVKKNEAAADKYIFEACKSGTFIPRFKWLQLSRRLTKFDDSSRAEVKAEVERGNHHVVYFLAMLAPTHAEQIEWMRKAAVLGNPEALYALSAVSSKSSPKDSLELLRQAIKLHSAEAMFTMGAALTDANAQNPVLQEAGLTFNDKVGRHLLKLASMVGSTTAHFWLGNAYYDANFGLPKDDAQAYRHFEAGSEAGHAACGAAQGYMLLRGLGVKQDTRKGLSLVNSAANAGYPHAVMLLAYALYEGLGVPADASKAADLLQEAAAMGMPQAYVYLAYITLKGGNNLAADERMADRYVRMAGLDMKDEAKRLFEELKAAGKWEPRP